MNKRDIKNIASIKFISTNIFSTQNNPRCGLDVSLKLPPVLYFLYKNHINFNPKKPDWFNRDRLFFSQGHAAPVLYSTLYHFGFGIKSQDLKTYAQQNSKLPMIPQHSSTASVDATTYPLGQDIAQATGLALAQNFVSNKLSMKKTPFTYVLCIDESLHNGFTYESMSFAGHFKLNNLIIINVGVWKQAKNYKSTFSDKLSARAEGTNFNYINISLGNIKTFESDLKKAIKNAKHSSKPSFINVDVGMAKEAAFDELMCYIKPMDKRSYNEIEQNISKVQKRFTLSSNTKNSFDKIINQKIKKYKLWDESVGKKIIKSKAFKDLLKQDRSKINLTKYFNTSIGKSEMIYSYQCNCVKLTTIKKDSLHYVQEKLLALIPSYIDGTGEVLNVGIMKGIDTKFSNIYEKNIVYGVRDASIPAIVSGMALYDGLNPAFFVDINWVDYTLAGLKSASILKQNILAVFNYVYSGQEKLSAYHKVAEQLAIIRSIPNLVEWKPIDAHEGILAYNMYLKAKGHPTVILLRNEVVKTISNVKEKDFAKGAYILKPEKVKNFKTVICSGGEMEYVYEAFKNRKDVRIISMPSVSTFRKQSHNYKKQLIPNKNKTFFIEIGNDRSMFEFANKVIGIKDNVYHDNNKNIILSVSRLKKLL